jgi:hypothetical protein
MPRRRQQFSSQPEMDSGIMDMMGLAQAGEMLGFNQPPPINELMKILDVAVGLQGQERELSLDREKLALEQQKFARPDPQVVGAIAPMLYKNPEGMRSLMKQSGIDMPPPPEAPAPAPTGTQTGASKIPAKRMDVKSQKAFAGYQPPAEDAQAVMDEQGNIINFVRRGTGEQINDFVPDAASIGGYGASKYALAQQMKALGSLLGFGGPQAPTTPY